jgi:hypothetical protein
MYRWLWRWAIWCYMLVRIARLPLAGIATHPDCAAGLSPLSWPTTGFASFVFALAAALAGAWGTQLLAHHTTLAALWPGLLAFMIVSSVIACGPLLMFIGHLFRARRQTLARYAELARVYTERFHAKWIERPDTAGELLGTEDIQSLASLGTSFHIIENTRMFPFGPRKLIELWLAALLPMLPLVAGSVTTEELMRRFASTILGGIPI